MSDITEKQGEIIRVFNIWHDGASQVIFWHHVVGTRFPVPDELEAHRLTVFAVIGARAVPRTDGGDDLCTAEEAG